MKRIVFLCIVLLFLVGCKDEAKVTIPEDLPEFVQEDDFASVDWDKRQWNLVIEVLLVMPINQVSSVRICQV